VNHAKHRPTRVVIATCLLTMVLGVAAALALQTHNPGADVDPSPANPGGEVPNYANNGGFGGLSGLAVDGSGGDLYAIDTSGAGAPIEGTGAVHRFDNAGARIDTIDGSATPNGSLSLFDPADVAVDSSGTASDGNFYVTDPGNNLVDAFDSTGAPLTSFGDTEPSTDGQLRGLKTPAGSFSTPCGLTVEPETGNLFVADQNNSKIWIFDSSGAYEDQIVDSALQGPCGLAFGSSGEELYVRNSGNGNVLRFHRSGPSDYGFAQLIYAQNNGTPENFEDDGPSATDVAVNTTDGHVFIDLGDRIAEFEPFGGQILSFAQGISSNGIAIDSAGEKIYATDSSVSPPQIRSFSTVTVTVPDVTTGAATNVTGESATLNGSLDALGIETECEFEYDTAPYNPGEAPHGQSAPCEPAGPYFGAEAVHADVTGLTPGTVYHYRLHAESAEGENNGAEKTFTTDGAPIVESFSFTDVDSSTMVLHARVNPAGAQTAYRFEYTTEADFEANGFANATKAPEPDGKLGSPNSAESLSETISGLQPATRYAVRIIAGNEVGQGVGGPKHPRTLALATAPEQGQLPGQGFLPDNRAWELVSPPDKHGVDVLISTTRIRAAADGSAISFPSLGGFADVLGSSTSTEYIAERTAMPGTNGWATHGITPLQDSIPINAITRTYAPLYDGEFSPDLDEGIFLAWSPLTAAPNVALLPSNLYRREDLRSAGAGTYGLLSDASEVLTPPSLISPFKKPRLAGTSADLQHVIFESKEPLRKVADGENVKLYKSDAEGVPRLIAAGPNCPNGGSATARPCAAAGLGATASRYTPRTISSDGSRVEFTTPVGSLGTPVTTPGAYSRVFQHDDGGTASSADDVTIQLDAAEMATPAPMSQAASFQSASTDNDRVFFVTGDQLTETAGAGSQHLYRWERQEEDETQQVSVDATGGSFTLTAHAQPTRGGGNLTNGSTTVSKVSAGSFMVGQSVSGSGIAPGTTIEAMGTFKNEGSQTLTLSDPATATVAGATIDADVEASTPPLPFDAGAATVQAALEALVEDEALIKEPGRRLIGEGNVEVSGGPGGPGAATPYEVTFTGALHGVNVQQLSVDDSALVGPGSTATVSTPNPVHNLTLIAAGEVQGVVLATEDGHRLYFINAGQLVPGAPPVSEDGLYLWQDGGPTPEGSLSFVGEVKAADSTVLFNQALYTGSPKLARISQDGKVLLFGASDGSGLAPGYESVNCGLIDNPNKSGSGCSEAYLYRADSSTPKDPDLICVSCNPTGAAATANAYLDRLENAINTPNTVHLNHALSNDGRYVFFSSAEKLLPEDSNGVEDAYEFDTQTEELHLLSSGESTSPSYFAEASADGKDTFILTRERLSGWDTDGAMDLYDAKANGGLPEPPPPPPSCQGEACQPAPVQLDDPTPASSAFSGPGNEKPPIKCRKGQRRLTAKNGKTRCVKRHNHGNRKRANHNRRAGR
jgi:hypothetical protein